MFGVSGERHTMAEGARYFKHSNTEGILGRGFCYYEFAPFGNELVAMRQIEADGQTYLTSNLPSQNLGLCDQPLDVLHPDFLLFEIEQKEFDETWNRAMDASTQPWREFKTRRPVGTLLAAKGFGFYPHGVLAEIGESFWGVLDYATYRKRVGDLGVQIQTSIVGFDEKYRWALLEFVAGD
jgi:hypothetical protein